MSDELNEPLGLTKPIERVAPSRRLASVIAGLALAGGAVAVWTFSPRDPYGDEPHATAHIEVVETPAPQPAVPADGRADAEAGASRDDAASARDVERRSGVKVTRPDGAEAPDALIIQVDKLAGVRLPPAPDKRLVEKSRFGPLPKIGADGAKPSEVYARPVSLPPRIRADAPRIAIVVGGVGLEPQLSNKAIDDLPDAVSLAFAPYGADIEALAARAREQGHEILLQAPMEPYDYPRDNPGPHTLLTVGTDMIDDLHWLMGRFVGYAGVVNFLGGRFTADERALTPALKEIAARGLFVLDDGTSPQSLVTALAPGLALPAARADLVIDAKPSPEAIDAALARLEALARQNGAAIGFANALPASIARIARFARDLERRGVALVPASAMAAPGAAETRTGRHK